MTDTSSTATAISRQAPAADAALEGAGAARVAERTAWSRPGQPAPAAQQGQAAAFAPGSAEYNAAMAERFRKAQGNRQDPVAQAAPEVPDGGQEASQAPAATVRPRPADVPEKFWDPARGEVRIDALLKSYRELERRQSQLAQAARAASQTAPAATEGPAGGQEARLAPVGLQIPTGGAEGGPDGQAAQEVQKVQQVLADLDIPEDADAFTASEIVVRRAGLDPEVAAQKILTQGDLDPEDYDALVNGLGLPKALVKTHVKMMREAYQAQAERNAAEAIKYVGGEAQMTALMTWASGALTEAEKAEYNARLRGPDWRLALDALRGRFYAASGRANTPTAPRPPLVQSGSAAPATVVGFRSLAEQTAAIRDPRYRTDEAYRAEVIERIRARTF